MVLKKNGLNLSVELGPLKLKNPVMAASGTFGYGEEYAGIIPLKSLGALITKGLSLEPRKGNPPPRLAETPSGMLNAIGLENVGVEAFLQEKMPFLRKAGCSVLVNIFGGGEDEYAEMARRLSDVEGIAGLEANISCPNVKAGGTVFATEAKAVYQVTSKIRQATSSFLMVKLSPNVGDIVKIAAAAEEAGADAVSLINTLTGMAIDIKTRTPVLANITGGLSGPAIKPIGLRMVWQVARAVRIPVVGIGGITTAEDALEYLIAGATAIQVGSAHFVDPRASLRIIDGIQGYLRASGLTSVSSLIGSLKVS
ncbi:MAG TPA: dihydroorotate dehydrogenase [Thermodesulfobacteriota bacterium]|nr:dihydroorotate dehydrogenase [Thermodesulfobacteriota bacterium]